MCGIMRVDVSYDEEEATDASPKDPKIAGLPPYLDE